MVYIPSGTYTITSTITIPVNKRVHLLGDGIDRTIITMTSTSMDMLWIKGTYSTIENMTLQGPNASGSGRGIVIGVLAADGATDILRRIAIIGVRVRYAASWSLYVIGLDEPGHDSNNSISIWGHFERSEFWDNKSNGGVYIGQGNTTQLFRDCAWGNFAGYGLKALTAHGISLIDCTLEQSDNTQSYISLDDCNDALILHCWFETHGNEISYYFIALGNTLACRNVAVDGCRFVRNTATWPGNLSLPQLVKVSSASKAVAVRGLTAVMANTPDPNRYGGATPDIAISAGSSPTEVTVGGSTILSSGTAQAMALSTAHAVALVNTGPRLTTPTLATTERDSPTSLAKDKKPGDTIFNSDLGRIQVWSGSDWLPAAAEASGGAGTYSGTLLVGSGTFRISAFVSLATGSVGAVSVDVTWTDTVTRTEHLITAFATAGSYADADAFLLVTGAVMYTVTATGISPSFVARIRAEGV